MRDLDGVVLVSRRRRARDANGEAVIVTEIEVRRTVQRRVALALQVLVGSILVASVLMNLFQLQEIAALRRERGLAIRLEAAAARP